MQHANAAGERGVPAKSLSKFSPSWEGVRGWWTRIVTKIIKNRRRKVHEEQKC
jgi:hypothetical protein